jgi:hypothetical protein
MARLQAAAEIDAPAEHVWAILVDLPAYDAWNPFTYSVASSLAVGAPLTMRVRLAPGRERVDRHIVSVVAPPRELCWDFVGPPALLRTRRGQLLTPLGARRTRYSTYSEFHGLLGPALLRLLRSDIQRGLDSVALALKARAEQTYREENQCATATDSSI